MSNAYLRFRWLVLYLVWIVKLSFHSCCFLRDHRETWVFDTWFCFLYLSLSLSLYCFCFLSRLMILCIVTGCWSFALWISLRLFQVNALLFFVFLAIWVLWVSLTIFAFGAVCLGNKVSCWERNENLIVLHVHECHNATNCWGWHEVLGVGMLGSARVMTIYKWKQWEFWKGNRRKWEVQHLNYVFYAVTDKGSCAILLRCSWGVTRVLSIYFYGLQGRKYKKKKKTN